MRLLNIQSDGYSNLFLYGTIMFANIDYKGVFDYGLKAFIGGAVWFGFKVLQDYYSVKVREKARRELNEHGKTVSKEQNDKDDEEK